MPPPHLPGQVEWVPRALAVERSWAPGWLFGPQPPAPLTHLAAAPACRPEIKNRFSAELGLGFTNSMTVSSRPAWSKHSQRPAEQEPRRGPAVCPSPPALRSETQSTSPHADVTHGMHATLALALQEPWGRRPGEAGLGFKAPGEALVGHPRRQSPPPLSSRSRGRPAVLLPAPHLLTE